MNQFINSLYKSGTTSQKGPAGVRQQQLLPKCVPARLNSEGRRQVNEQEPLPFLSCQGTSPSKLKLFFFKKRKNIRGTRNTGKTSGLCVQGCLTAATKSSRQARLKLRAGRRATAMLQVSRLVKPGGAHQKEQTKGSPREEQTGPSGCMCYIRATVREGRRDGP